MSGPRWVLVLLVVLLVVLLGLFYLRSAQDRRPRPRPLTDLGVAAAWLECLDCQGAFLQRIRGVPPGNRDTVTRFLASALLNGPPSDRVSRLERDLRRTWYADSAYAARQGDLLRTKLADFLVQNRRGFDVLWRSRAATALGVLRTDSALAALERALKLPFDSIAPGDSTIPRAIVSAQRDSGGVAPDYR
jgi:hypothetical protein